jgi:septal ring factor EnvC (AmiA/AmiB activator)
MIKRKLLNKAVGVGLVVALASLPLLSGCVSMASQEQLTMLENARKAAEAAEADLVSCKQNKAKLEKTLAKKKQTLKEKTADRDAVKKALENF